MKELDSTGVPLPFECFFAAKVGDLDFVEKQLHDAFDDHRVRSRREFFNVAPERIKSALMLATLEDVTPRNDIVENAADLAALNKARTRRGSFNFGMVGIPPGAVLTFEKEPSITATVLDGRQIEFEGEATSLSTSALTVIHRLGYTWKAVAGPDCWQFEGETLSERRRRMEEEG